jgi:DNA primase
MTAPTQKLYLDSSPDNTYGFRKCCEAIRGAVPIEDVAPRYTRLEPLDGRAWFSGRCPMPDHQDRSPSFYLYHPGRYYCYGCERGGDVVDLEFFCGDYSELWEAMIALAVV